MTREEISIGSIGLKTGTSLINSGFILTRRTKEEEDRDQRRAKRETVATCKINEHNLGSSKNGSELRPRRTRLIS